LHGWVTKFASIKEIIVCKGTIRHDGMTRHKGLNGCEWAIGEGPTGHEGVIGREGMI